MWYWLEVSWKWWGARLPHSAVRWQAARGAMARASDGARAHGAGHGGQ